MAHGKHAVKVMYAPVVRRARLADVAVCGSVWFCAVCASRITEGRRGELEQAITHHHDDGGSVYFSTLTIPHTSRDALKDFQNDFQAAEKVFRQSRFFRALKGSGLLIGTVRAAEVTHWLNGWHYHAHILWFASRELDVVRELRRPGYVEWARAVRGVGRSRLPDYKHGFYVAPTFGAVADYVAKYGRLPDPATPGSWGPESEMTKGFQKLGRRVSGVRLPHRSPFEILRDWGRDRNGRDAALYKEYAYAFRGQQQLRWSPKLKKRLEINERTDNELADSPLAPYEILLGRLFLPDWEKVVKHNVQGQLVDIARDTGSWDAVRAFLDGLGAVS
jgi:hypothetical protein